MTEADERLDEFGKHALSPLRAAPPLDPQEAARLKQAYLVQANTLRQSVSEPSTYNRVNERSKQRRIFWFIQQRPLFRFIAAGLIALVILFVGSTFTVSAAQASLPGQALYPLKSWSENVRLALVLSPQLRLNLVLKYTNRRMDEISQLISSGQTFDEQTSDRFQQELDDALQLAAQLNDTQIQSALIQIRNHAESQGMTVQQLIGSLPPQAEPAILRLQDRLNEQVQLSSIGEKDPKEFRFQVHERQLQRKQDKHPDKTYTPGTTLPGISATPMPGEDGDNNGNGKKESTQVPGHGEPGNDQDPSQPGNGNHGQNPTHTPKP